MRFLYRFIFFSIISLSVSCTSIKTYNDQISEKKHTVVQLQQDLDLVHQLLEENHPGLYWYISKESLDKKFDSVKNTIVSPLTSNQFYIKLTPLVASIKCGHTSIKLPAKIYNKNERTKFAHLQFPLDPFTYEIDEYQKLYVIKSKNDSTVKSGSEVIEIDGINSGVIVSDLLATISSDGYNKTHQTAALSKAFASRYYAYYGKKDSIRVKYKLPNDSIREAYFKNFNTKKSDSSVKNTTAKKKINNKLPKYRGKYENGEPQLDFKFLGENKKFAYLKIRSFSTPMANYEKFYEECFDSISSAGTQKLIIDLRDNGGGSLDASRNLFAYLTDQPFVYLDKATTTGYFDARRYGNGYQRTKYLLFGHKDNDRVTQDKNGQYYSFMKGSQQLPPHKNNFKGNIYVLINGYTFSAASLLSANLKGIKRAIFVGEETGGGANQCVAGQLPVVTLNNSKLLLRFGLYRMAPIVKTELNGRGVFPDIAIKSTLTDKINGVDQELNWIINQSKTSK